MARQVLVVDDDDNLRFMLQLVLEDAGYAVQQAPDGVHALALLRSAATLPCAILLDLNMPTMTGWEFRAEQRQDPALAAIPVVVVSADRSLEGQPGDLDAAEYFHKPIRFPDLLAALAALCS